MPGARARPPFGGSLDPDSAVYVISVAAELTGLHPQTLRAYERMGLIRPGRTVGGGRRYSQRDLELLRLIADLTSAGIGLEGVRRILALEHQVAALQQRNAELIAEADALREALRQSLTTSTTSTAGTTSTVGNPPPRGDRLPVLRQPSPGQSVVVWRRPR